MKPAEQEAHVGEIIGALARYYAEEKDLEVGHGESNLILGASGYSHQIDASVAFDDVLALYECKYWGKNVSVEAVLTLLGRVLDIRKANPGVQVHPYIVMNKGLTKGAKKIAQHFGIGQCVTKSSAEFGLSLLSSHHAGVKDTIRFSDF